jgi:hypothetical protein
MQHTPLEAPMPGARPARAAPKRRPLGELPGPLEVAAERALVWTEMAGCRAGGFNYPAFEAAAAVGTYRLAPGIDMMSARFSGYSVQYTRYPE